MMKSEFESLAGRNVTDEQYKAIETLYMSSNLEKVNNGSRRQNIHGERIHVAGDSFQHNSHCC